MEHYKSELLMAVPVATAFQAITTSERLKGWWTDSCEIGSEVGAQSTFASVKHTRSWKSRGLSQILRFASNA
jgi:uncharacterized protein YndB with AHSA1/START domain